MKTLRADLSAEGRLDILAKVMAYRGGAWKTSSQHLAVDSSNLSLGYSQEVVFCLTVVWQSS